MNNFTTDTYEIKRKINTFSNKITNGISKVQKKFVSDMIYGLSKSKSILISNIADGLMESTKKINTIERLSKNLLKDLDSSISNNFNNEIIKSLDENPVILVDDSDVIKPYGKKFDSLGTVRDGSSKKKSYEKGYIVTEMVALTKNKKQPISLYSHIHSSTQKEYKSTNQITFQGLDTVISALNKKATFIFDRGYDMNELFKYMNRNNQEFIVRLTEKRNLFFKGKWYKSKVLRDSRKGKIKTNVLFQGEKRECYISHLNVQITASKKNVRLVIIYGLGDTPMMLATNKNITSKSDVIGILRLYMSRWRVEEYFRFKKQEFDFENFRVRDLKSINNLNQILTYLLGFIGILGEDVGQKNISNKMIRNSKSLKSKILFYGYQITKGIFNTLAYAKTGISAWYKTRQSGKYVQLEFKLVC